MNTKKNHSKIRSLRGIDEMQRRLTPLQMVNLSERIGSLTWRLNKLGFAINVATHRKQQGSAYVESCDVPAPEHMGPRKRKKWLSDSERLRVYSSHPDRKKEARQIDRFLRFWLTQIDGRLPA